MKPKTEKPTESQLRALKIISAAGKIRARKFGELMWEKSPAKERVYNIGNGAHRGVGLWLCAGSYLCKLALKGFIDRDSEYDNYWKLTERGKELLKNSIPPSRIPFALATKRNWDLSDGLKEEVRQKTLEDVLKIIDEFANDIDRSLVKDGKSLMKELKSKLELKP